MDQLVLFGLPFSSPVRSVQLLADVMGINLTFKQVDLLNGEHLKPEYLKLNPHHTIPTLQDPSNDLNLYESRAIMRYMVNQYAPNSTLYPADPKKRARVDMALDFDGTTLTPSMGQVVYSVIKGYQKSINWEMAKILDEKLALLNDDLGRSNYIAGDELTIADLSLLATWTSIEAIGIWKVEEYKNIHAWVQRIKESNKIKDWANLVVNSSQFYGKWVKEKMNL